MKSMLKTLGYTILRLVLIFLSAGLVVPHVTYQTSVTVNQPIERTFDLFNDIDQLNEWIPEVTSVEPNKELPDRVGSQYRMKVVSKGNAVEMIETLTEYEVNKKVTLDFDAGNMHKTDIHQFSSDGLTTVITSDHVAEGSNYIHKCMFAFFKVMFRNIDQGYLDNFKEFAEKA